MTGSVSSPVAAAPDTSSDMLGVQSVRAMLDCSSRHVYRMSDAGLMPRPVKLGSLVRWRRSTGDPTTGIEDWIKAGCPAVRHVSAKAVPHVTSKVGGGK